MSDVLSRKNVVMPMPRKIKMMGSGVSMQALMKGNGNLSPYWKGYIPKPRILPIDERIYGDGLRQPVRAIPYPRRPLLIGANPQNPREEIDVEHMEGEGVKERKALQKMSVKDLKKIAKGLKIVLKGKKKANLVSDIQRKTTLIHHYGMAKVKKYEKLVKKLKRDHPEMKQSSIYAIAAKQVLKK